MKAYLHLLPLALATLLTCALLLFPPPIDMAAWYALLHGGNLLQEWVMFAFQLLCLGFLVSQTGFHAYTLREKVLLCAFGWCLMAVNFTYNMIFQSCLLMLVLTWVLNYKAEAFRIPDPLFYALFGYFALHLLSLLWVIHPQERMDGMIVYALFLIIPWIFCKFHPSLAQRDQLLLLYFRFMSLFVLCSLACAFVSIANLNGVVADWLEVKKTDLQGYLIYNLVYLWTVYQHPTYHAFAYCLALVFGFYLWQVRADKNHVHTVELLIMIPACLLLILLTQSRIGLFFWSATVLLGILYLLRKQRKIMMSTLALCLLGAATLVCVELDAFIQFINDPIREQNFVTALSYLHENPWIGTGVDGIRDIMYDDQRAQALGFPGSNKWNTVDNPHQQFLGDWMQTGIPGLILIVGMMGWILGLAIKRKNFPLLAFWCLMLLLMQIEMPLYRYNGCTYFLLFTCLLVPRPSAPNATLSPTSDDTSADTPPNGACKKK